MARAILPYLIHNKLIHNKIYFWCIGIVRGIDQRSHEMLLATKFSAHKPSECTKICNHHMTIKMFPVLYMSMTYLSCWTRLSLSLMSAVSDWTYQHIIRSFSHTQCHLVYHRVWRSSDSANFVNISNGSRTATLSCVFFKLFIIIFTIIIFAMNSLTKITVT